MTFGQKLPSAIKKKMPQSGLGKLSGINGNIIGKYERTEMKPSIDTAKKLADALSVSLDYLVGDGDLKVLDKKRSSASRILRSSPKPTNKIFSIHLTT